jgi:hypothetical protein
MKPRGNVAIPKVLTVRGTGKNHNTSVPTTHARGGAVLASKKAKSPLDNRGPKQRQFDGLRKKGKR